MNLRPKTYTGIPLHTRIYLALGMHWHGGSHTKDALRTVAVAVALGIALYVAVWAQRVIATAEDQEQQRAAEEKRVKERVTIDALNGKTLATRREGQRMFTYSCTPKETEYLLLTPPGRV